MRAKVEPQQSDYYDHGAFAHGQNLPIKIKEERNKKYVTNKMCSSSPGFEPGPPEELDLYLPKSLIFLGHCIVFYARTPKVTGSNPVGAKLLKMLLN